MSDFGNPQESTADDRRRIERLAKIMSDPLKSKILVVAAASSTVAGSGVDAAAPAGVTVRQISDRIGEPRRRVRYHLDDLCSQGIMERLGKRPHGGFVEDLFVIRQPLLLSRDEVATLSITQQQEILLQTLKMIFSDVTAALQGGTGSRRPEWAAVHQPGEVDEQGWKELAAAHEQLRIRAQSILANSAKRLRAT